MVETSLANSPKRAPGSAPHCRNASALPATDDSEPELATEAEVREAVVVRARSEPDDGAEADRIGTHLFDRPLRCCPTCGSEQLEPVVEGATQDVHFLCRNCGTYWHVELGFVHRVTPSTGVGGHA